MHADWSRPSAILQSMADALSTHEPQDTTSDLCSSHEALALFAHACMITGGFRLLGFDQEKIREAQCHELAPRLPTNWNASFNTYSFVYAHQESTRRFVIKIDRKGGKADIHGLALNDDRVARSEIITKDFISNGALPVRITIKDGAEDRSDLVDKLQNVFISENNIRELASLIFSDIVKELLPTSRKNSLQESEDQLPGKASSSRQETNDTVSPDDEVVAEDIRNAARRPRRRASSPDPMPEPAKPYPFDDPLSTIPRGSVPQVDFPPPAFEDPYDINRRRVPLPQHVPIVPDRPFGDIGADDLNPPGLGPHDPLRPGRISGRGGTRGMHPTMPGLGGLYPQPGTNEGDLGFDQQVPPGARYDPFGPGGHPRFGGGRPGAGGGFGNNPFEGFGGGDII